MIMAYLKMIAVNVFNAMKHAIAVLMNVILMHQKMTVMFAMETTPLAWDA